MNTAMAAIAAAIAAISGQPFAPREMRSPSHLRIIISHDH